MKTVFHITISFGQLKLRFPLTYILIGFFLTTCRKDYLTPKPTPIIPIPETDPIAFYNFNGNAIDQSKFKNNGSIFNATLTADSFGNGNSAYNFNNAYIEIPDNDILDINTNQLTISAWIKPIKTGGTYIVGKTNTLTQSGQLSQGGGPFSLDIFPGQARCLIYGDSNQNYILLTGGTFIKQNVWQHLAVTWDGKLVRLYYNGQIEATGTFTQTILKTNGKVYIGTYKWVFPSNSFEGIIDNVRIYNRFLTTNEIQDIYKDYK